MQTRPPAVAIGLTFRGKEELENWNHVFARVSRM
jgi:hypothetical protein